MNNKISKWFYLIGKVLIVVVFLYFGIESIFMPDTYSGLVPDFVASIISPEWLVMLHGAVEVIFALFVLFNLGGVYSYMILILSFMSVLITVSSTTFVRDVGILGGLLILISNFIANYQEELDSIES